MAGAAHVAWPFVFTGLFGFACAASVGKTSQSLMRQESQARAQDSFILNPGGQAVLQSADSDGFVQKSKARASAADWDNDFCDDDFIMGNEDSSDCVDSTNHKLIDNPGMCQFAADRAGAKTIASFQISPEWYEYRPRGCFKYACHESSNGICYFFNAIGNIDQKNVSGTPVCQRPKYLFGEVDTNGNCPKGYKVIMNEDECTQAADCLSIDPGAQFLARDDDIAKYDDFPKGCFVRLAGGEEPVDAVYFNTPLKVDGKDADPANPKGKPFCIVEDVVEFKPPAAK